MGGVNIPFVPRAAEPVRAASRAHKQCRKINYKLRFDDFKPRVGCNRPCAVCQNLRGIAGVAAERLNLPTW
jgi:hypothetical protein